MKDFLKKMQSDTIYIIKNIVYTFSNHKLAKKLLIIFLIKFVLLFIVLKAFIYPNYLKPKYESKEHRIEIVTEKIITNQK